MIALRELSTVATLAGGRLIGESSAFHDVSTDTRQLSAGDLFVCLKGSRFDAHDFINEAARRQAAGVMVSQEIDTPLPQIRVDNTLTALGDFARAWRQLHRLPLVAITGSNGKTTTKNLLAGILQQGGPILATLGNYNNAIGVPLTLCRLRSEHRYAAVELGTNQPGEIAALAHMASPTSAVITSIAPAHLSGFGSVDAIASEKASLFDALPNGSVAVAPSDCLWLPQWQRQWPDRSWLTFGFDDASDVRAEEVVSNENGSRFTLAVHEERREVLLPLLGHHNVSNALAAAAAATGLGLPLEQIATGLATARPASGRLEIWRGPRDLWVLDDSYNANPLSVEAGIRAAITLGRPVWVVLGDMAELGSDTALFHTNVGLRARELGVKRLLAVGDFAPLAAEAFGAGGIICESRLAVADALAEAEAITVLVKGSRSAEMDQVTRIFREKGKNNGEWRRVGGTS